MYTIFFAAFVLMVLTVLTSTDSSGPEPVDAKREVAAGELVKPFARREYPLAVVALAAASIVALVGLYLRQS